MSDENTTVLIISVVGALTIFICGYYIGNRFGKSSVFAEAVKHEVGEWVIQADGKPEFRFKK